MTDFASHAAAGSLAIPSSLAPSQNLLLDSSIRDWVVIPLLVIMIAAGLLRHHVSTLLKGEGKKLPYVEGRTKSLLQRASRIRTGGGGYISEAKWEARRRAYAAKEGGILREEAEWAEEENEKNPPEGMDMSNPMAAMGGSMKGQMVFMVQNMVMMQGISHFFKGFVLVKVPFPLTNGFKQMFQRGLDLSTLDVSYVSSVSWYFLVMYGLRAFFRLAIGDPKQETMEAGKIQKDLGRLMNAPPAAPGQNFDAAKALRQEAETLEIVRFQGSLDDAEKRLLGKRYPKKKLSAKLRKGGKGGAEDILGLGSVSGKGGRGGKKKSS